MVEDRLFEAGRPIGRRQHQVALGVHLGSGAINLPGDAAHIRARGDYKVVLQLTLVSVEDQIDAGINLFIVDLAVGVDAGVPFIWVVADKIAHDTSQRVGSGDGRGGIGAYELHAQRIDGWDRGRFAQHWRGRLLTLQIQDDLVLREKHRVTGAAGEKPDRGVGLSLIGFEAERNAGVMSRHLLLGFGGGGRLRRSAGGMQHTLLRGGRLRAKPKQGQCDHRQYISKVLHINTP